MLRYLIFTMLEIQVMVFWVVMLCNNVVSETLLSHHIITWHHNPEDHDLNHVKVSCLHNI